MIYISIKGTKALHSLPAEIVCMWNDYVFVITCNVELYLKDKSYVLQNKIDGCWNVLYYLVATSHF